MDFVNALRSVRREEKAGGLSGLARREALWGLAFLSPWLLGFLLFTIFPMLASLYFSFTNFDITRPETTRFIGLENYKRFFTDPVMRRSLWITVRFMLISVPVGLAQPLLMAAMLNAKSLWGKRIFRTLFFMPSIIPVVSTAYIWQGFMNTETGWLNRFLMNVLRIAKPPQWFNDPTWVYPALIIMGLWGVGNALIYTLAGMQGVPTEYYEAARVDGANALHTFFRITLPMISPVIFYNLVLMVIGLFQYFILAWIVGGSTSAPGGATQFYNVYLYKTAFVYSNMGYGSTLAWALFFMGLTATLILFGTAKYWVYYAAED